MSPLPLRLLVSTALLLSLAACGKKAQPPQAPPPPEVGVVTAKASSVPLTRELVGRLAATRTAEVRARVPGIVERRLYTEGSDVKAGQALFEIDAAPYRATLASAQAQLARAEANLLQAQSLADRYAPLAKSQAVSQQEALAAQASAKQAAADVAAGKAAVQTAQINLGYATVTSPIRVAATPRMPRCVPPCSPTPCTRTSLAGSSTATTTWRWTSCTNCTRLAAST